MCAIGAQNCISKVLTGDALSIRGCGRTDFQSGDAGTLYDCVTQKLFTLDDTILVYLGHDYNGLTVSTIGEEKKFNARFKGRNRDSFIELMNNLNLPYPQKMTVVVPANEACGHISLGGQCPPYKPTIQITLI